MKKLNKNPYKLIAQNHVDSYAKSRYEAPKVFYKTKPIKFEKNIPSPSEYYRVEISMLNEYSNGWSWGSCPFHHDSNPSFTFNMETGAFRCMSSNCGVKGGSLISFVCQLHDLEKAETYAYLEAWYEHN